MKPILLYTNDLVDIINIPLEGGGHTKQFYIVEKDTLHYSNFQKNGNKDNLEHKEILNAEIYKSFISREYYIKY